MLQLPDYTLIFPDAPFQHPYSEIGRMWYGFPANYSFFGSQTFQKQTDLLSSRQQLTEWLHSLEEKTGIPLSQTVLAGFSQGGAMTLDIGTTLPLKALMVLSGYMHIPVASVHPAISKILMVHGRQDQVVPLTAAHQARDRLLSLGAPVQYEEFDMGHEIRPLVLEVMQKFLEEISFPANKALRIDL
jgi:phospholipase/carboxylesterase